MSAIFCFFYFSLIFCSTSADLVPPFYLNDDGSVGIWEFSGATQVKNENLIMLVPPLQYANGAIWTNVEIPKIEFQINYTFQISDATGGGGLGFWFITEYGASGTFNGGPNSFNGIALLATVRQNGKELHFHLIQNNGLNKYSLEFLQSPDFVLQLDNEITNISLTIRFQDGFIIVFCKTLKNDENDENDNDNKNDVYNEEDIIINEEITVSIDDCYIGLTAQSSDLTSRIDLLEIRLKIDKLGNSRKVAISRLKNIIHYRPEFENPLRNPLFVATIAEIEKKKRINKEEASIIEASASEVLSIIEEAKFVSYEVASFKELNSFLLNILFPYSQKWHKRTTKIVENSATVRDAIGTAWNYTFDIMRAFNSSIKRNALKAKVNIISLEEILLGENENSQSSSSSSSSNSAMNSYSKWNFDNFINDSPIVLTLLVVTLTEMIAALILLLCMNNSKLRAKYSKLKMLNK